MQPRIASPNACCPCTPKGDLVKLAAVILILAALAGAAVVALHAGADAIQTRASAHHAALNAI
jgi:hypothetical protein